MNQIKSVGIIGYGRFGSLLEKIYTEHTDLGVKVYSRKEKVDNEKFFEFAEVCQQDLVIPAVPISKLEQVLKEISPLVREDNVVMDITSVKLKPLEWMKENLNCQIIASHPVFGPDSTKQGTFFQGLNMMMENISAESSKYDEVKKFWVDLGVNVVEITCDEHDKYSAYTINYNHLIGRIGEIIGIKKTLIDTKGFEVILDAMQYVTNDTWELFQDMQNYNPYASEMREKVRKAIVEIENRLI